MSSTEGQVHSAASREAKEPRVLVVEDEVVLADGIARGLDKEGFEVEVVHDGLAGLERGRSEEVDAIVLDIMLPGMNGYKVCRNLREEGVGTPILMLTAKSGEYDEAEALDTGADDFLSKPFSFVVLVARLHALLRRSTDAKAQPMVVGDLVLDPLPRTCRRGEVPIELTTREYELLEALMRNPGTPVSKQELLEKVWGAEFDGDPNVVEVYIGYLRRKIDRPFDRRDIETVRGVGYRMSTPQGVGGG
ncbi:MAG: response regulator transcription factor [Microthrixaceae bacterium]|nr:response regulator transcription factor [Microthrixaceae bacterium]MCO5317394.1 response regulator transcription factor [Microthrixaceae bacterium]